MPCNKSSVRALLGEGRVEVLEWGHEGEIEADTQTDRWESWGRWDTDTPGELHYSTAQTSLHLFCTAQKQRVG